MSDKASFFAELKRRNVYKVAVAYAVVGWLLIQVATQVFPFLNISNWAIRLVILLVAAGFPIALVVAWAFELTPEGLKRTEDADSMPPSRRRPKGRAWLYVISVCAAVSIALFVFGRSFLSKSSGNEASDIPQKSIAVLPFENLSDDKANAYFAEGVQDEILTRLARVADLKVISRTSTQKYKSAPDNLREIAKQLGVAHIVEGSVQKANDKVRVNVQLINALNDAHLWAEIYDRSLADIFATESDIATNIAATLQAKLTGSEKQMMAVQPTEDTEAYELYHKGRSSWDKRSGDNIPKAIVFYEQAIARDPKYAPAYAGLATAYVLLPYYTGSPRAEALGKSKETALKALELDPNLAEAHAALGKLAYFSMDLPESARHYQRAIELKPNYATAHQWYGNDTLIALGRMEEAIAESRRAVELDPLSPIINADLGVTLYLARRYDAAEEQLRKTLAIDPTFFYAHYNLGIVRQLKGDLSGAQSEYEKALQLNTDSFVLALRGAVKAFKGDKKAAQEALEELDRLSPNHDVDQYSEVLLQLSLGQKEKALTAIERGYEARDGSSISWIKVDPFLDPLRGDPRFEAVLKKIVAEK